MEYQTEQRSLLTHPVEPRAELNAASAPRSAHDFRRILIYPPTKGVIQRKLAINKPEDEYEREADHVSEQVMRMPEPQRQRVSSHSPARGQDRGPLQLKRVGGSGVGQTQAPSSLHDVLQSPGQSLDPATRAFMESRFGHDFSRVRVHSSAAAGASARRMDAQAYTVGGDVVFAPGQYAPATSAGRQLLAHELTHVVQQQPPDGRPAIQRKKNDGQPATVDPLEEQWQDESDEATRMATEGASPEERALGNRMVLLLSELRPVQFKDEEQVDDFISRCQQLGASEDATLKGAAAAKRLTEPALLDNFGEAFPNIWAAKVYQDFHSTTVDLDRLRATYKSKKDDALATARAIPAEVWDQGLPVTLDQARNFPLDHNGVENLIFTYRNARKNSPEVTDHFARAMQVWLVAGSYYGFANNYQMGVVSVREQIRRGEVVGSDKLYQTLQQYFDNFRTRLAQYEAGDAIPTLREATFEMSIQGIPGGMAPIDGLDAFWAQMQILDHKIAGTGYNDCLSRTFTWAFERSYFNSAGIEVWQSIKENGWKMLVVAAAILGAQFVPVVDVALDIVLLIEFGLDALSSLADLVGSLHAASSTKSVVDMERASARLAQTLTGTAAKILLWAIAWGAGKIASRATKYVKGKNFIEKYGDTPAARKALGDARGDIAAAERNLAAEQERLAAAARKQQPTSPTKPATPPDRRVGGFARDNDPQPNPGPDPKIGFKPPGKQTPTQPSGSPQPNPSPDPKIGFKPPGKQTPTPPAGSPQPKVLKNAPPGDGQSIHLPPAREIHSPQTQGHPTGEAGNHPVVTGARRDTPPEAMAGKRRVGDEHVSGARPSTEGTHQIGQTRKLRQNAAADLRNAAAREEALTGRLRQLASKFESKIKNLPPGTRKYLSIEKISVQERYKSILQEFSPVELEEIEKLRTQLRRELGLGGTTLDDYIVEYLDDLKLLPTLPDE